MLKTNPIFVICTTIALLALAICLPAIEPTPSIAKTAGGLHLALLVLAMVMLRAMVADPEDQTWPAAFAVPLAIVAGAVAMGVSPQDSMGDVARRIAGVSVVVGAGFAGAMMSQRPRGWPRTSRRDAVIAIIAFAGLLAWNHLVQFPQAQGTALMFDIVGLALAWCYPALDKAGGQNLPRRSVWAHHSLDACATVIITSYLLAPDWFYFDNYNAWVTAGFMATLAIAILAMNVFFQRIEKRPT